MVYIISQKQRVLDGLKLGSGFLLIAVNYCAACRAAVCRLYEMYSLQPHLFRLMFTFS